MILWRRTKLGITLNADEQDAVNEYIEKKSTRTSPQQAEGTANMLDSAQKVG